MVKKTLFCLTGFLLLFPFLSLIYLSISQEWVYPNLIKGGFSFQLWVDFFTGNNDILSSLLLSFFISTIIASLATVFGFVMSRAISEKQQLLEWAFYPYLIAPVILGVMLQYYFVRIGITGTIWGVLLAQILFVLPYSVLFFSTFWNDKIRQTAFQATTLGANSQQVLKTILIPMARPWFFLCFAQCFLISWFEYGITALVGVGKVETLTIKTMLFVKEANPHLAALSSCLMIVPVLILLVVNRELFTAQTTQND